MSDTGQTSRWLPWLPYWLPDWRSRGVALATLAALQLALLGAIVGTHVKLLKTGREITLRTTVVDPRDIFRGDYVILNYPVAQNAQTVPGYEAAKVAGAAGEPVYALLQPIANPPSNPGTDGDWRLDRLALEPTVANGEIALKVQSLQQWTRNLEFGIERYYVPEGKGHDLETLIRQKRLDVIVAVGKDGDTGIKGLAIDGKRILDEPLF